MTRHRTQSHSIAPLDTQSHSNASIAPGDTTDTCRSKRNNHDVQQEQRYENDENGNKVRIQGRPGDVKINKFVTTADLPTKYDSRDMYYDYYRCKYFFIIVY